MAKPQLEDGYIRIATEIYEAMARIRIPGETRQVVDVVIRKTYGFHKKADRIPLSQFCEATGQSRGHVARSLNRAVEMNILIRSRDTIPTTFSLNKNHESWNPVPKKGLGSPYNGTSQYGVKGSPNNGSKSVPITIHSKDTTKDITKDNVIIPFQEIIEDLNCRLKERNLRGNYRHQSKATRGMISARWKEGAQLEDFQHVHRVMVSKWWNDDKMSQYLRPSTLYRASKFEGYLNQKSQKEQQDDRFKTAFPH